MDSDVRVLPFTEEEKARLNEKVRKMKFTRPPPKLPGSRNAALVSPSRRQSLRASGSVDEKSVDDSGISSCGSEKCETPPRSSPTYKVEQPTEVACDKYICDGDDWVPDDSAVELRNDLEIDVCSTSLQDYIREGTSTDSMEAVPVGDEEDVNNDSKDGGLEIDVGDCAALSIDVSSVGPLEKIDTASPVVFSERLHAALTRKRRELLDISPLPDTPIGRFEEPRYGRLLLSSTFPTLSLQQIMTSASKNLEGYRVLGRPRVCLARGKPDPEPALAGEIEAELKKERMEMEEPRPTILKRKRKRRRNRRPDDEESAVKAQDSQDVKKEVVVNDGDNGDVPCKERKEFAEQLAASVAAEPPIKMIFRKDADRKISGVRLEIPNLPISTAKVVKRTKSESSSGYVDSEPKDNQPFFPSRLSAIGTCFDNSSRPLKIRIRLPAQNSSAATVSPQKVQPTLLSSGTEERSATVTKTPDTSNSSSKIKKETNTESDDDIIVVHESIKKPKQNPNPRPWAQLNVMEQSYVAKLAWLVKLREVDITSKDWFQELYGKVEKTIYHLDLDISNLRGTKMNYKKRLEQAKLTCHQLRVLLAKRQGRPRDDANRPLRIYSPGPGEPWPPRLLSATRWKITEQSRSPQKKMVDGTSYPVESDPLSGLHRVVDNLATESARQQADVSHVPSSPVQSKIAFPKIFSRRLVSPPSARRKHLDEIVDRLRSPPEVVPKDPMPSSQSSSFCRDHVEVDVRTVTQIRQEAIQGTTSRSSDQRKVLSPDDLKFFSVTSLKPLTTAERSLSMVVSPSCGNNRTVAGSLCKHNAPFWSEHAHLSESRVPMFTHNNVAPSGLTAVHEH